MSTTMVQGFADPSLDAQDMFRLVLDAMAHPGRIRAIAPSDDRAADAVAHLDGAAFKLALTLMDFETPVWLDPKLRADRPVVEALRFHCGCPIVEDPTAASFACIGDAWSAPPLTAFHQGTSDYPDRSTTILMQVQALDDEGGVRLTGPGIKNETRLAVESVAPGFWREWSLNQRQYPLGIDLIITAGRRFVALPRSVSVEV